MSKLRSLSTSFWSDPFVEELTPSQKLLFIYLITNDKTNMLGIYESSIKKMAFETNINKSDIEKALKEFERLGKVKYINNYVVLTNYMKHQNYNTNMKKSAIDIYNSLPNELKDSTLIVSKDNPSKGFETLLNHFGMVPKREVEVESELEDEIELESKEEYSDEVLQTYHDCLKFFPEDLYPKNKNSWLDVIEKLNRLDKIPFEKIISIVKWARNDEFWKGQFLTITKLRKNNRDDIKYFKVFDNQGGQTKTAKADPKHYTEKTERSHFGFGS